MTAVEMAGKIANGDLTAQEVMAAHYDQIERVNPQVNAIVTLIPREEAMAKAKAADEKQAAGEPLGVLHGLPIAHKDLTDTKGMRTTYGSPIFKDFVPEHNALIVERLQEAGALSIGKTNTPEFGAGSNTFNPVFGATRNPYNLDKTCGGSSGGAAVALACGMVPLADGSDMGGSLRNPAAFSNVVGFRPSPGRVPVWPKPSGWTVLGVEGPMARTVADLALMLSAIAGPTSKSPIALETPGETFAPPLDRDFSGTKIAWSENLGDLPIAPEITRVLNSQRGVFDGLGIETVSAEPNLTAAQDIFQTQRGVSFGSGLLPLIEKHRDQFKETIIWNAELAKQYSALDLANAEIARTALYHSFLEWMEPYDYLVCPVTQVLPFDLTTEYISEINGEKMDTYIHWMSVVYYITVLGLPAISVPAGFSEDGLPVGMQIVGKHHDDLGVLQIAHAFEQATKFNEQRPPILA